MMTAAVSALPNDVRARAIELTRTFDDFTPDDDPHNEHNFGSFEIDDQSMQYGSEDPGDSKKQHASSRSCSRTNTEDVGVRSRRVPDGSAGRVSSSPCGPAGSDGETNGIIAGTRRCLATSPAATSRDRLPPCLLQHLPTRQIIGEAVSSEARRSWNWDNLSSGRQANSIGLARLASSPLRAARYRRKARQPDQSHGAGAGRVRENSEACREIQGGLARGGVPRWLWYRECRQLFCPAAPFCGSHIDILWPTYRERSLCFFRYSNSAHDRHRRMG